MGRIAPILILAALPCGAEIIERVAASVGNSVIAESEVMEEARITAFIDDSPIDVSPGNKRKVADRLIDQFLIRREIEFTHFQIPPATDVNALLAQVTGRYPDTAAYQAALQKYQVTEDDVKRHLLWQVTLLRFIEYRFQPSVQVTNLEVRQEYRKQQAAWKEKNTTEPPPLDQIRPEIEKIVTQRLTDSALDRWLGEVRTQNEIRYHDGYK